MDFFTSLLKTYEKAELADLVDHQKKNNEPVLLPLYHTSLKSRQTHEETFVFRKLDS